MKKVLSFMVTLCMVLTLFAIVPAEVAAGESWMWPSSHAKTWSTYSEHKGIDLPYPGGTPVLASKSGTAYIHNNSCNGKHQTSYPYYPIGSSQGGCTSCGASTTCSTGKCVYVIHWDGSASCYMHLSSIAIKSGTYVGQGDVLGYIGTTGASTGNHLHFEIAYSNNANNSSYFTYTRVASDGLAYSHPNHTSYFYPENANIPTNVQVNATGSTVKVSWDTSANATYYDVYLVQYPWGWEDIKYSQTSYGTSSTFYNVVEGGYAAFVIARPNADSAQSGWVMFDVVKILGDDFYAYIQNTASGFNVANDGYNNAVIKSFSRESNQIWRFLHQSDGGYKIVSSQNGLVLGLSGTGTEQGDRVVLCEDTGSLTQRWYISGTTDNYTIKSANSEYVFDIAGANYQDGTPVQIWYNAYHEAQKFSIIKIEDISKVNVSLNLGDDFYAYIQNTASGFNVANDGYNNVAIKLFSQESNQIWRFLRQNDGGYKIVSSANGLTLGLSGTGSNQGDRLLLCTDIGNLTQRWYISGTTDNYTIKSGNSEYVFDIAGANYQDGTPVQIWYNANHEAQKFSIKKLNKIIFNVTFNANGGTTSTTSKNVTYNSVYGILPIPEREGYTFLGWYTAANGGTKITNQTTVTTATDHTLYGQWEKNIVNVSGITLSNSNINLMADENCTLTATVSPSDADNKNVIWSSSDESVATVKNGVVTAVGKGTATITVTTEDGGYTATCKVTVEEKSEIISPIVDIATLRCYGASWSDEKKTISVNVDRFPVVNVSGSMGVAVIPADGYTVSYEFTGNNSSSGTASKFSSTSTSKYTLLSTGVNTEKSGGGALGNVPMKIITKADATRFYVNVTLSNGENSVTYKMTVALRDPAVEGDVDISEILPLRADPESVVLDNDAKTIYYETLPGASSAGFAVSVDNNLTKATRPRKLLTAKSGMSLAHGDIKTAEKDTFDRYVVARRSKGTTQTYQVKVHGGDDGFTYTWYTVTVVFK